MDISKHKVLKDMYDTMGMIEDLGHSTELTRVIVKLGEIMEETEILIDEYEALPSKED